MKGLVWVTLFISLLLVSLANAAEVDKVVEEKLEEQDEVSVIVKLKDEQPEQFSVLNNEELAERREMVKRQQERVLSNVNSVQKRGLTVSNRRVKINPDLRLEHSYSIINGFSGKVTSEGLERLRNDPNVEKIYFDDMKTIFLDNSIPTIKANKVWSLVYNDTNITGKYETVCIIDTGVDYNHTNLGGGWGNKVIGGYNSISGAGGGDILRSQGCDMNNTACYDDNGHGTHVAGIIASNHTTYRGVAPDAKLVVIKACDSSGSCLDSDIIAGIDWCTNNASTFNISVISMSLGAGTYTDYCNEDSLAPAINTAVGENISVVVAAGNDNPGEGVIASPACVENATPIGAVDDNDIIQFDRNSLVKILAPGINIYSTYVPNTFTSLSGTSMSTPHAAGAFALINQYRKLEGSRRLTPAEIEDALNDTGEAIIDGSNTYRRIDIYAALLSLDKTPPQITFVAPTLSNNTRTSDTLIFINVTSSEILDIVILEWNNGTKINQTMNGSGMNWYINKTDLLELGYSYTVFGNDSAGNFGVSELRFVTVNATNIIPVVEVAISSTDNLNRTNGTLIGSWAFSDADGDNQISNETKWFNNSIEISELINLTSVSYTNTTKNQTWTFSVRVYDGINWSEWANTTIYIRNAAPELENIANITVNETGLVSITANATDIDYDAINYSVNDSRFSKQGNQFTWLTNTSDSGVYHINVIANDSEDISSQVVVVTVLDAPDFDNDGNPDFNDTDDDNDGLDDVSDYLKGNVSDITSTISLKLKINGSENLTQIFNGTLKINITDQSNNSLVEFDWNFTNSNLVINWTYDYAPANGTIIIRNLDASKTVYINKSSSSHNYVCIADYDITGIGLMTSDCSAANETKVPCSGSSGSYSCTNLGSSFKVSGLAHSGVKGIYVAPVSDDSGGNPGGGGGGGGGSGGGGGTSAANPNEASRFFAILTETVHPLIGISSQSIPIERLSFNVNKKLYNVRVKITALNKSASPVKITGEAYQYLELSAQNLNDSDLAEPVEIKFKVSKEWLNKRVVDKNEIYLYRYREKWDKLETNIEREDNATVFYVSKTPGFSIFAIAASKEAGEIKETAKPAEVKEKIEEQAPETVPAITEIEGSGVKEDAGGFQVIIGKVIGALYKGRQSRLMAFALLVIVLVGCYIFFKRPKRILKLFGKQKQHKNK